MLRGWAGGGEGWGSGKAGKRMQPHNIHSCIEDMKRFNKTKSPIFVLLCFLLLFFFLNSKGNFLDLDSPKALRKHAYSII